MAEAKDSAAQLVIEHVDKLISSSNPPEVPELFAHDEGFLEMHERMLVLRRAMANFARGDLSESIHLRGFSAGALKALQSHLRHLTWQAQQVEKGDFTQRVDFLGEFSEAFNNMVMKLATTIDTLKQNEEALTSLTETLQHEVELRSSAVYALKQSEAKFKYLAEHDHLTGALNRRSFHSLAVAEMQSAHLAGVPCCIVLLDIDHFKKLNDTYGHLDGDLALKQVVEISSSCLRQSDILGRFGGEEFIFFFSGADLKQGVAAAERIRKALEKTPIKRSSGEFIPVTASLGVSVSLPEWFVPEKGSILFQQIIGQADEALYEAKDAGRNRVCAALTVAPAIVTDSNPIKF